MKTIKKKAKARSPKKLSTGKSPAKQRCRHCGKAGHNKRTCGL